MSPAVVDTDILSEITRGIDQHVIQRATAYLAEHRALALSVITVTEMVKGLHKRGRDDAIARLLASFGSAIVLAVDTDIAVLAGRIYGDLERRGMPIGRADPLIAATAIQHGRTLVTGNTKHFQRIVDLSYPLDLDNWREAND